MKNLINLCLIVFTIVGCASKQQNEIDEINAKIASTLFIYGRQVVVKTTSEGKSLSVELSFKSPSFIDSETQKMILSLLAYHMYDYYNNYNEVLVDYIDEGLSDTLHYQQGKEDIEKSFNEFLNNKIFLSQVSYVLNNMSQDEILFSNLIIKELNRIMPDIFNFNGSFWLLLYQYSLNFSNDNSIEVKNFTVFVNSASVKGSNVNPIKLKNIVRVTNGEIIQPIR